MIQHWKKLMLALAFYGGLAAAQTGRGELLYSTYCNSCHAEQIHWRGKSLATDWASLVAEVHRWQSNGNLEWSMDDVEGVASYLNEVYYHFPPLSKSGELPR